MEMQNNMTPNNPSSGGMPAGTPPQGNPAPMGNMPEKESQMGPLVGIIVIVVLLAAGGYYYWMQNKDALSGTGAETEQGAEEILNAEDKIQEALQDQSTSSAYSAIEADLNATDLDFGSLNEAGNELGL